MFKKKYIVFAGNQWYPQGGMKDLFLQSDNIEDIKLFVIATNDDFDWCQIVEKESFDIVLKGTRETDFHYDKEKGEMHYINIWEWEKND